LPGPTATPQPVGGGPRWPCRGGTIILAGDLKSLFVSCIFPPNQPTGAPTNSAPRWWKNSWHRSRAVPDMDWFVSWWRRWHGGTGGNRSGALRRDSKKHPGGGRPTSGPRGFAFIIWKKPGYQPGALPRDKLRGGGTTFFTSFFGGWGGFFLLFPTSPARPDHRPWTGGVLHVVGVRGVVNKTFFGSGFVTGGGAPRVVWCFWFPHDSKGSRLGFFKSFGGLTPLGMRHRGVGLGRFGGPGAPRPMVDQKNDDGRHARDQKGPGPRGGGGPKGCTVGPVSLRGEKIGVTAKKKFLGQNGQFEAKLFGSCRIMCPPKKNRWAKRPVGKKTEAGAPNTTPSFAQAIACAPPAGGM